jgi:pimeloyl-ACP methyl ester carboxylesterase
MEEKFSLAASDAKQIYGVLHHPNRTSSTLVLLVHGLTGHMNEFLHIHYARYQAALGVAVIRFNQYDDQAGARRFHESTISLHVTDTRTVMAFARERGYKNVVLVGHSLGAPVAITACDPQTAGLLLWDPTTAPALRVREWETRDRERNIAYLDWEKRIILGEAWLADARSFPDPFARIAECEIPVKIIAAEQGGHLEHCRLYREALGRAHQYVVVPGAGHVFADEGAAERLALETASWVSGIESSKCT